METNEKYTDELEQMRHDMNELRSLLSEQQIVNERLMRRAMSKDMGKERSTMIFSIVCVLFATPIYYIYMPQWGMPMWFTLATIAFLLIAAAATVWSVKRLMKESLLTGDLLVVAKHINDYKQFSIDWLKFGIPFIIVWLSGFFYYASRNMDTDYQIGFFCGAIVGAVIGGAIGIYHLIQSRRRLNRILKQIEEIKSGE